MIGQGLSLPLLARHGSPGSNPSKFLLWGDQAPQSLGLWGDISGTMLLWGDVAGAGVPALLASLASYWGLEEAAGDLQDSYRTVDLTRRGGSGGPAQVAGALGFGQSFASASSDYADATYAPAGDMQFIHDFSGAVSFWAYILTGSTGKQFTISEDGNRYFSISARTDRVLIESRGTHARAPWWNANEAKNFFSTIAANAWHHIWFQSDGSTQKVFVDNVELTTASTNTGKWFGDAGFHTPKLTFGASQKPAAGEYVNGRVDEVIIFSRYVPTAGERTAIYNAGVPATSPTFVAPTIGTIDLFLLSGQSNASSRVTTGYTPDRAVDDRYMYWYQTDKNSLARINSNGWERLKAVEDGYWGAEIAAVRTLRLDGYNPAFLKVSKGSTTLASDWAPAGAMWTEWLDAAADAVAALQAKGYTVRPRGMLWSQGESDSGAGAAAYEANFRTLVADARTHLGTTLGLDITGFRFITALTQPLNADRTVTRAAQVAVMAENALDGTIDTTSYGLLDTVHYNGAAQSAMGSSFAAFF